VSAATGEQKGQPWGIEAVQNGRETYLGFYMNKEKRDGKKNSEHMYCKMVLVRQPKKKS